VRRGGLRGLGTTLISQRAAVVNKNVLEMLDVLIVLRTIGPNDREEVDSYVKAHGTGQERSTLLSSLASLAIGEAWVWEPGEEPPIFERIRIRERRTFNSSATPKPGERRAEPRRLAAVDLEALRGRMAATIERAKADDPKALRVKIAQLERDLTVAGKTAPAADPNALVRAFEAGRAEGAGDANGRLTRLAAQVQARDGRAARALDAALIALQKAGDAVRETIDVDLALTSYVVPKSAGLTRAEQARLATTPGRIERLAPRETTPVGPAKKPRARILRSLAWWAALGVEQPTRPQVAFVARYTVNGHFNNTVGGLKADGLIEYPNGCLALTREGFAAAPSLDVDPSRDGLIEAARAVLRVEPLRRVFDVLVEHGEPLSREKLATAAGYTVNGHFNNVVGRLRTLGLADYPSTGTVSLSEVFSI